MIKNNSQIRLKNKNNSSVFEIVFLVLLGILFFYPPYLRGLYFNREVLSTHLFSLLLFGVYLVLKGIRDEEIKFKTILDYAIVGLIAAYILPLILGQSANIRMAIGEILKYINYLIVFIIASDICKDNKKLKVLLNVIVASGIGVAILGFDAASAGSASTTAIGKISKVINSVCSFLGAKNDVIFGGYVDGNINSTLQYKNACAAFLGAIFFVNVALLVETPRKWQRAIYGAAGFLMLTALILTGSRGMYLIFAVAFLVSIPLSPKGSKIDTVINNLFIDGVVVIFLGKITSKITDINNKQLADSVSSNTGKMWLLILAGMIISAALVFGISFLLKYINNLSKKAYIAIFAAGVVVFGCAVGIVLSTTKPLILAPDKIATIQRNVDAEKGKYKIKLNVDVTKNTKNTSAWQVQIYSQTLQDMLSRSQGKSLYIKQGKNDQKLSIDVEVPKGGKKLSILLTNSNTGTTTTFDNLKVTNPHGKVNNIVLSYKFLPQSISDKLQDISGTTTNVIERGYFNKDSMKIIKDHPLVGAGGGAWGSGLYFKYQSYMYYTTQAHNFIAQLTIETGIVGLLVYIVLLIGFAFGIYKYVIDIYKNNENGEKYKLMTGVIVAAGLLIVHSFMDFDLSLAAVYFLLWELLAVVNSYISEKDFKLLKLKSINLHRMGAAITVAVVLIYVLMLKVGSYYSEQGATSLKNSDNLTAQTMYEQALSADPLITSNSLQEASPKVSLANIYLSEYQSQSQSQSKTQTQAQTVDPTLLTKAKKKIDSAVYYEKNNPIVLLSGGVVYFNAAQSIADVNKGLDLINKAVKAQPMNASNYQQKAAAYNALANIYGQTKQKNKTSINSQRKALKNVIVAEDELKAANNRSILPIVEASDMKTTVDKAREMLKTLK